MVGKPEDTTDGAGTPAPTGAAAVPQTSEGSKDTPPKDTPKDTPTLTVAQAAALATKAANDALAKAGRTAQALEKAQEKLTADRAKVDADRAKLEAAEADALKDDPDAFRALEARRERARLDAELREREAAIAAKEQTIAEREKEHTSAARVALVNTIAAELDVDPEPLMDHGGDSDESIRKLARALPKLGKKAPPPPVDSGAGGGGGTRTQAESLKLRYPTMH